MKRTLIIVILSSLLFLATLPELSAKEKQQPEAKIYTEHRVITGPKQVDQWIGISEREVKGVQVQAHLDSAGEVRGNWRFSYSYPEKVNFHGGVVKKILREGTLQSKKGVVQLPMKVPKSYRITVHFEGTVDGRPVKMKQRYSFDIPRIQQKGEKLGEKGPIVLETRMTGRKVDGHWMMAVARPDSQILYIHEGKDPRFQVQLPKGEYILKTVFYGEVDGIRLGMQESNTLKVKADNVSLSPVPGKNNEYRTVDQAVSAIKGMRQSGRLAESEKTYSAKAGAYSGWAAASLVLISLAVYRKKKTA